MRPPPRRSPGAPKAEWEVLTAAARTHLSAADRSRLLHALTAPIDWEQLLELAFHHDLAPLLLRSLETIDRPAAVPASILTKLQRARAANALRNRLLFEELACLLNSARSRRIDVIALKGAALAETVYGDRALRPMRDLDLLVRQEHLAEVEAFLTSRGYGLNREWARAEDWHRRHDYHLAYRKQPDGLPPLCIELHWHLVVPSWTCRPDLDGLWARAVPATIAGIGAMTLSPEDAVLHLCLHACKHRLTAALRTYCDIAETLRRYSAHFDWPAVRDRALEWRMGEFVHVPLAIARDVLGAHVPGAILDEMVPESFDPHIVDIAARLLAEHPLDNALFEDLFNLTWGESQGGRIHVLSRVLSRDLVATRNGVWPRMWWGYLERLAHLSRSYGPAFWRFARRGRLAVVQAHERSQLTGFLRPLESVKRPAAGPLRID
jgi:hypothetical protein